MAAEEQRAAETTATTTGARLLKGAPVARALTEELAARAAALREAGRVPTLALVRVGAREDDMAYERGILSRCEKVGIEACRVELAQDASQAGLESALRALAADAKVHGILLFRPLPAGLDEAAAAACVPASKDVDCMGAEGLLATLSGQGSVFAPCTAEAVVTLLDHYGVELDGARVAVVGRSLVIGRPVAALLLARNATVTVCHTHTADLAAACREVDVIVAAAGHARTVGAACVRAGQVVVDVGVNVDSVTGALVGDVDAEAVAPVVSALTPVPGGVGAVTTAVLARHVIEAAERAATANAQGGFACR